MKHTNFKKLLLPSLFFIVFSFFLSCKKEEKVDPKPVADFTYIVTGNSVQFTNTSTNYVSSAWTFSDAGSVSTGASPMHTFSTSGAYKVKLVVTSKDGSTSTKEKTVEIQAVAVEMNLLLNSTFAGNTSWTVVHPLIEGFETPTIIKFDNKLHLSFESLETVHKTSAQVYQAIELQAGTYKVDGSFDVGADNFRMAVEFCFSKTKPSVGVEIPFEDKLIGFQSFYYCDHSAFSGPVRSVSTGAGTEDNPGCRSEPFPARKDGKVTITTPGTYYFIIRIGSYDGNFGANFNVTSVELKKI